MRITEFTAEFNGGRFVISAPNGPVRAVTVETDIDLSATRSIALLIEHPEDASTWTRTFDVILDGRIPDGAIFIAAGNQPYLCTVYELPKH